MAKAKAITDKYTRHGLSQQETKIILRDIGSGITKEVILRRYKINTAQYNDLRNYNNQRNMPKLNMPKNVSYNTGSGRNKKSGARRQGSNDICLCGSGKKHKDCCGKKKPL